MNDGKGTWWLLMCNLSAVDVIGPDSVLTFFAFLGWWIASAKGLQIKYGLARRETRHCRARTFVCDVGLGFLPGRGRGGRMLPRECTICEGEEKGKSIDSLVIRGRACVGVRRIAGRQEPKKSACLLVRPMERAPCARVGLLGGMEMEWRLVEWGYPHSWYFKSTF